MGQEYEGVDEICVQKVAVPYWMKGSEGRHVEGTLMKVMKLSPEYHDIL